MIEQIKTDKKNPKYLSCVDLNLNKINIFQKLIKSSG